MKILPLFAGALVASGVLWGAEAQEKDAVEWSTHRHKKCIDNCMKNDKCKDPMTTPTCSEVCQTKCAAVWDAPEEPSANPFKSGTSAPNRNR